MQAAFKENDTVYTPYGYGVLVNAGKKSGENVNSEEVGKSEGNENGVKTTNGEEKCSCKEENGHTSNGVCSMHKKQSSSQDQQVNLVTVKMRWGGIVSLDEKLLRREIKVNIKTFFGARTKIPLSADLSTTIGQLKTMLIEAAGDDSKNICNLRLIYPMGVITELSVPSNTLESYQIPDGANLVLLAQTTFAWDEGKKGDEIKLSNNGLTANKSGGDVGFQTVLGSIAMSSGRRYWEIKIDKFVDEEDLFIGVAKRDVDLNLRPLDTKAFWGYMPLCGRKFAPPGELCEYGFSSKVNDVIGVLLEFKQGIGTLSFYKNGTNCGIAYTNLTGTFYPAISLYYGEVQITLDPRAQPPLS